MPNKLTEKEAENKILDVCKEISTKDEVISFLGWKDGDYVSNTSRLILHNSKFDVTWDSTTYNNFVKLRHKGKHSLKPRTIHSNKRNPRKYTTKQFIELIQKRFPNKNWDFSKTNYINYHTKVCIICHEKDPITGKEHGEFWAEPANLLSDKPGERCPKCSGKYHYTTEEFVEKAKILCNNRYNFDKTIYINSSTKTIITCPSHGDFYILPTDLLYGEKGCPMCSLSHGETAITRFLIERNIKFTEHLKIDSDKLKDCPNKNFVEIDYYLKYNGRKIFIEFNGEQHYSFRHLLYNKSIKNFHRQLLRDLSVVNYAKDNGIELLEIPYCDLSRVPEILDAFLERGEDITTYVPRDLLSGPSLPLGLPLL